MTQTPGRSTLTASAEVRKKAKTALLRLGYTQEPEFDVRKSARKQVGRELETFSQRNFILNN
jgi:hypothetical protein